jgi:hypothetical protein
VSQQTLEQDQQSPETMLDEPGGSERLSHYVDGDQMLEALINGTKCYALCGKYWLPTCDGHRFPLCQVCKAAFNALPD